MSGLPAAATCYGGALPMRAEAVRFCRDFVGIPGIEGEREGEKKQGLNYEPLDKGVTSKNLLRLGQYRPVLGRLSNAKRHVQNGVRSAPYQPAQVPIY